MRKASRSSFRCTWFEQYQNLTINRLFPRYFREHWSSRISELTRAPDSWREAVSKYGLSLFLSDSKARFSLSRYFTCVTRRHLNWPSYVRKIKCGLRLQRRLILIQLFQGPQAKLKHDHWGSQRWHVFFFLIYKNVYLCRHDWSSVVKWKPEKISGLNGIRTHDLCDTAFFTIYGYITNSQLDKLPVGLVQCSTNWTMFIFFRSSNIWAVIYSVAIYSFHANMDFLIFLSTLGRKYSCLHS